MSHRTAGPALLLAALLAACGDAGSGPLEPGYSKPSFDGSSSGCYTTQFTTVVAPVGPLTFSGVISGDLEGTITTQFDPTSIEFAGVTISNSGKTTWVITGGIIPGLSGFETSFDNRNINTDRPGSPATVFENKGTHRALTGVAKANLTYKGSFTAEPVPEAILEWKGVICP